MIVANYSIGFSQSDIEKLALHVTGKAHAGLSEGEWCYYLGGGYWRAYPLTNLQNRKIVGFRLSNPDRTPQEIKLVEQALEILSIRMWKYEPTDNGKAHLDWIHPQEYSEDVWKEVERTQRNVR